MITIPFWLCELILSTYSIPQMPTLQQLEKFNLAMTKSIWNFFFYTVLHLGILRLGPSLFEEKYFHECF